jgi:hypothetical protein
MPGDPSLANSITRRVTARGCKGSSDAGVGEARRCAKGRAASALALAAESDPHLTCSGLAKTLML